MTARLPVPSQPEGDGLASDVTHTQSLSGGDPERVAIRPGYPTRPDPHATDGNAWVRDPRLPEWHGVGARSDYGKGIGDSAALACVSQL